MVCSICKSADRADIENALLNMTTENGITLDTISDQFGVKMDELKKHALLHSPLSIGKLPEYESSLNDVDFSEQESDIVIPVGDSIAKGMKKREADVLATMVNEYLVTMKIVGRRIHCMAVSEGEDASDVKLTKLLTKSITDLYLGLGSEIRNTVKTLADIDRMLNGDPDNNNGGMALLVNALKESSK